MKKHISFILAAFLFLSFQSLAIGQENLVTEPVAATFSGHASASNPFTFTATDKGALLVKPGSIFTEGGEYDGMVLPYLLSDPKPIAYPAWAMRQRWEGRFDLAIEILADGTVGRTYVMHSTGHKLLDDAAEKAIRSWKFHPAMQNGKPVLTCVQIPVLFKLAHRQD